MSAPQGPASSSRQVVDRDRVLGQVSKILASRGFNKSQRRRDLLSYLVSAAIEGPEVEITERMLAAVIYGRMGDFDPASDGIVRVETSRLRAALDAYYAEEAAADPV